MTDIKKRMQERAERVRKAQEAAAPDAVSPPSPETEDEPVTDFWKLPKTGARTTLLNSAWTWTLIIYVSIMVIAVLSVVQSGLGGLERQSDTVRLAIAAALIYPAWRIGLLISRFMKRRGIGAGVSVSKSISASLGGTRRSDKTPRPGSVEARMEARRARLEKARREGKI